MVELQPAESPLNETICQSVGEAADSRVVESGVRHFSRSRNFKSSGVGSRSRNLKV